MSVAKWPRSAARSVRQTTGAPLITRRMSRPSWTSLTGGSVYSTPAASRQPPVASRNPQGHAVRTRRPSRTVRMPWYALPSEGQEGLSSPVRDPQSNILSLRGSQYVDRAHIADAARQVTIDVAELTEHQLDAVIVSVIRRPKERVVPF